jgi:tetratricopeptide (TPR) repeat protein
VPSTQRIGIALGLCAVTIAAYAAVGGLGFVTWDDPIYVSDNPRVAAGLTWEGVKWAFTTGYGGNWHPLTWLSHMLDASVWGVVPGPHHRVNLGIHLANTLLLFAALARMTGFDWRSGFVAALFAVHPLHVESVAWVSERKDVLSTLFLLLALHAYVSHARAPGGRRMALVAVCFALALLAKQMVVTLPFLLLLLDRWPLRREEPLRGLVVEKVPLFVLAALACVATVVAQTSIGAVGGLATYPIGLRFANAAVAYVDYVRLMLWPAELGPFYPHPLSLPWERVAVAAAALAAASGVAVSQARRLPWLFVGWFWYVGTLVPVIGIVQVGHQALADRYTYVPLVGLFIVAAWGVPELVDRVRAARWISCAAAAAVIAACVFATRRQVLHWKDSETLWRRSLAVTQWNVVTENNISKLLLDRGEFDEAVERLAKVVAFAPDYLDAVNNLGYGLTRQGKLDEGIAHLREAVRLRPDFAMVHFNLAEALARKGEAEEAAYHYEATVRLQPVFPQARAGLGRLLLMSGRADEAVGQFVSALEAAPDFAAAHDGLGLSLDAVGQPEEALAHVAAAVRLEPENADWRRDLGMLLARRGRVEEAVRELENALRLDPKVDGAERMLKDLRR